MVLSKQLDQLPWFLAPQCQAKSFSTAHFVTRVASRLITICRLRFKLGSAYVMLKTKRDSDRGLLVACAVETSDKPKPAQLVQGGFHCGSMQAGTHDALVHDDYTH